MPILDRVRRLRRTRTELRAFKVHQRAKKKARKMKRKALEKFYSDSVLGKDKVQRFYEASQFSKFGPRPEPPNNFNHWPADRLREQARFLYENDAHARRAIDLVTANIVGAGIQPIFQGGDPNQRAIAQVSFDQWAGSTMCDFDGHHNFAGLQSTIVRSVARDGSCFVLQNFVRGILKLQVLEMEYLNVNLSEHETVSGGEIRNGIEYDRLGRRTFYYMYARHPDDPYFGASFEIENPRATSIGVGGGRETLKIPAKRVAHIFRLDRAGQQDGISWLSSCLAKLWDLREYEEAKLIQQKLQCSITAFVQDNYSLTEEEREDFLGVEDKDTMNRVIQPGQIEELPTGKTVEFPPQAATPAEEFVTRSVRAIAASLGLSYEAFNDYSQVNFSSGRMGFIEMDRHMKNLTNTVFIPKFFNVVSGWFFDNLVYQKKIDRKHRLTTQWIVPPREMIDPEKETNNLINLWEKGIVSAKYVQVKLGLNFDKNIKEIIEIKQLYKDLGLIDDAAGEQDTSSFSRFSAERKQLPRCG